MRPLDPARVVFGQYEGYLDEVGDGHGFHSCQRPNELIFELSEDPHIQVDLRTKIPGPALEIGAASLELDFADAYGTLQGLEAYERLIHDVMRGDHTLFTRSDEIERLWEVSDPILRTPPQV